MDQLKQECIDNKTELTRSKENMYERDNNL